jgi:tetratricopeptide (TPR) repeat protein
MTDGAFPDRLTQLKSRWESDPSSRIFLQLAEEYRHQGRVKEALDVLDRGLREHPGYLSALVAKGRCHLELGEPEPARTALERVVKQDATQMVANKLLVRAYLDTGEPEKARERLDLYSLLTDSDPEIEELRRRLRAMEQPPQASPMSNPFPDAAPPSRPSPGGDIFDLGLAAPPAPARRAEEEDLFGLNVPPPRPAPAAVAPAAVAPAAVAPAAVAPAAVTTAPPEPEETPEPVDVLFPGLASRESRGRYLRALSSEGLFFLDVPAAEASEVSWEAIEEVVPVLPVAEPAWREPEPLAAYAEPEWTAPEVSREPPAAEETPVFDLEERTPWTQEPELLTPEPEPVPATATAATTDTATATLGELYLRQGHHDEAEQIFREVLRREPENATAQQGLARLAPAPVQSVAPSPAAGRPLEGRDLLAGYEPRREGDAKARRVFLLSSYLKRLRRGGQRDVS